MLSLRLALLLAVAVTIVCGQQQLSIDRFRGSTCFQLLKNEEGTSVVENLLARCGKVVQSVRDDVRQKHGKIIAFTCILKDRGLMNGRLLNIQAIKNTIQGSRTISATQKAKYIGIADNCQPTGILQCMKALCPNLLDNIN